MLILWCLCHTLRYAEHCIRVCLVLFLLAAGLTNNPLPSWPHLLAKLPLLSKAAAHCTSCPDTPHGWTESWLSSYFGVYSNLNYYILQLCIFSWKGKKNQRVFSLFFTSFSECRVQLLPGAFLTHINYLCWKVAHCRLLNSKFHIKKKSTSKCDTAESKTCVAN